MKQAGEEPKVETRVGKRKIPHVDSPYCYCAGCRSKRHASYGKNHYVKKNAATRWGRSEVIPGKIGITTKHGNILSALCEQCDTRPRGHMITPHDIGG